METLNSTNSSGTTITPENAILISAYLSVAVTIVVGNTCVVTAYFKSFSVRDAPFNVYILHLAISDVLVGVINIPYHSLYIIWPSHLNNIPLWAILLISYVGYLLPLVSVMLVIAMSFDRYRLMSNPIRYHQRNDRKTNTRIVTFTWVFTSCYVLFFLSVRVVLFFSNNQEFTTLFLIVYLGGQIILPLVVLTGINTAVIVRLQFHIVKMENTRKHSLLNFANQTLHVGDREPDHGKCFQSECDGCGADAGYFQTSSRQGLYPDPILISDGRQSPEFEDERKGKTIGSDDVILDVIPKTDTKRKTFQKSGRAARNLVFFVIVYVICWAPYHLYTVKEFLVTGNTWNSTTINGDIYYLFLYFNSAINPFLYAAMSARYRKALIGLFKRSNPAQKSSSRLEAVSRYRTEETAN